MLESLFNKVAGLKSTTGGYVCTIFIGNLMTYINREIDEKDFQYSTLCLYQVFLYSFVAINFVEVMKTS